MNHREISRLGGIARAKLLTPARRLAISRKGTAARKRQAAELRLRRVK